jgi:hypothetical protein
MAQPKGKNRKPQRTSKGQSEQGNRRFAGVDKGSIRQ